MQKKGNIIKIIFFIMILYMTSSYISGILKTPLHDQWEASGLDNVWKNKKYYDVLFCGPSMSITNLSSEELYLQYNLTSITIGAPFQPLYQSYYALKDALEVQQTQVVILDITSLFYEKEDMESLLETDEHHYLHYTIDGMHDLKNKYDAFKVAKEIKPDLNVWNYLSKYYYSHNNWENIEKENFVGTNGKNVLNGNLMLFSIYDNSGRVMSPYEIENTGEIQNIPEFNLEFLYKIIELCEQKHTALVLLNGKVDFNWNWKSYNAVKQIAEENALDYLDVNLFEDEAGIDWTVDLSDDRHTNVVGAKKITDYVGEYLSENYSFAEHRNFEKYEDNKKRYEIVLNSMYTKQELYKTSEYDEVIKKLNELDSEENSIIICIKGNILQDTEDEMLQILKSLGLRKIDFIENEYVGIIKEGICQEYLDDNSVSCIIGGSNNVNVDIELNTENSNYGVRLSGYDIIEISDGINIIVYNSNIGVIAQRVFDKS